MIARIEDIVEDDEDSVRIYALCANCTQTIKIIGTGEVSREEDVYVVWGAALRLPGEKPS